MERKERAPQMRNKNKTLDLQTLVVCSICTATTCVLATITIPMQPVPITMATVGPCIAGGKLGPIKGGLTQLLYLLLVLVGFPFTSSFKAGAAVFFGPTGGYLFGYVLMAAVTGFLYRWLNARKNTLTSANKFWNLVIAGVIGEIPLYIVGLSFFMMVTGYDLQKAIMVCVVPFLIGDFIKIILSAFVVVKTDKHLQSNNPFSVSQ